MKNLTTGNIYKTFFLFGLPLVLSGLLSQTYHVVDTMIAGKFLGDRGLAAIGAVSPFLTFVSSLLWGFGAGAGIYLANLFGKGEYKRIKESVYTLTVYLLVFCLVIAALVLLLHNQIFDFLKVDETLRKEAFSYFAVYMGGLFFILMTNYGLYILTAFGVGNFPFWMSLIAAVCNVAGNLLCVVLLKTGVMGLALSTVVASAVVSVFYWLKFQKCFAEMGVKEEKVRVSFRALKNTFSYSVPAAIQQSTMYLSSMLLSPLVNGLGPSASASYAVVSRVYDINAAVYQNSSRASTNYAAQCVGQGKCDKIKKGVFVGLLQGVAFVLPFLLVCSVFHKPVCSLFFKADADALTKEYSYLFASRYLPFIVINLVCNLFHGLFRGVKAMGYLFTSTLLATVVRYVASAILIRFMGMEGFYLGWLVSWVIEAIFVLLLFFFGKWNPDERRARKQNS